MNIENQTTKEIKEPEINLRKVKYFRTNSDFGLRETLRRNGFF